MSLTDSPDTAATSGSAGPKELIVLLAMVTALTALGIDLMLPAFDEIRTSFDLAADSTAVTGLVTTYFIGLGVGTIFYGPLSDHRGRRAAMKLGLGLYFVGCVLAVLAPTLPTLLVARFIWGLGAAGPRVVALAMIRDRFEGDAMARTMSTLMAIFIIVPVIAPTLGAGVLTVVSWRWLFVLCAVASLVLMGWVRRLPETLHPDYRIPDLRLDRLRRAATVVVTNRYTLTYTVAVTALYGVFASYLGSAEAIVDRTFDQADAFPVIFGVLAMVMGLASLLNGRIVSRVGTRGMVVRALPGYLSASVLFSIVAVTTDGYPSLTVFLVLMTALLACHALLLPNLNTLAMAPMAEVAGTASSVIGAFQLVIGALLGAVLDGLFTGSLIPLAVGFVASGTVTLLAVTAAGRPGRLVPDAGTPA